MNFEVVTEDSIGVVSDERKEIVRRTIAQSMATLMQHFGEAYPEPKVDYELRGTTAGHANSDHISINPTVLLEHWDDMLAHTIPHEVAHYVQFQKYPRSKPHGREWAYLMSILGIPANRTHSYKVAKARNVPHIYAYACADRCHVYKFTVIRHKRAQKGQRRYYCGYCHKPLTYWGKLT